MERKQSTSIGDMLFGTQIAYLIAIAAVLLGFGYTRVGAALGLYRQSSTPLEYRCEKEGDKYRLLLKMREETYSSLPFTEEYTAREYWNDSTPAIIKEPRDRYITLEACEIDGKFLLNEES